MSMTKNRPVVLKFGGTSVSTCERWKIIHQIVQDRLSEGLRPVVVCSALSNVSNSLEALFNEAATNNFRERLKNLRDQHRKLCQDMAIWNKEVEENLEENFRDIESLCLGISLIKEGGPKLLARMMSHGELLSTKVGAFFLRSLGASVVWMDARKSLVAEESDPTSPWRAYLSAQCPFHEDVPLQESWAREKAQVIITQGFIASNPQGETVLLGRGGSDTSASYFAAKLAAARCEIWTDVPGMYTANPRDIPQARLLKTLHYIEAQEIASMGAKVLHPKCIGPVQSAQIPLHIYCTDHPKTMGTVITHQSGSGRAQVKSLSQRRGITLISVETIGMWQEVGYLANLFECFKRHGLSIDLLSTSETNVTVSLDPLANAYNPDIIRRLQADLEKFGKVQTIGPCSVLALVGQNIRSILHKLSPVFKVFEEKKIYMMSQAASDLNLTFVVQEDQAGPLLQQLHILLFDHIVPNSDFGPTWQEVFYPEGGEAGTEGGKGEVAVGLWWTSQKERERLLSLAQGKSPLYVYHRPTLVKNLQALQNIKAIDRVFYALKANDHPEVLGTFLEKGAGVECVSAGELEWVFRHFPGLAKDRILFTPNFAAKAEYEGALGKGVYVTIDNIYPLKKWPEVFKNQKILLRVDPGRGRGHHDHVYTGGENSKFGISLEEWDETLEAVKKAGATILGLHAHAGSGISLGTHWKEMAVTLLGLAEKIPHLKILNLGGGLSIPYRPGEAPLDLAVLESTLTQIKEAYRQFEIWLEPGRFLVAQSGVLLTKVNQLKSKGQTRYVGVDTGMNSLIRPALYGSYHHIVNLTRYLHQGPRTAAHVVGPICESGDTLGYGRRLPETEEGDILLIDCAGAYGKVMSSHYNRRPPAEEVFLKE